MSSDVESIKEKFQFRFPPPVEVALMKKPYLGGYRHVCTGMEFFHGDSQTGPRPPKVPPEKTCSKMTQTADNMDKGSQCVYSQATQMWRTDVYIPSCSDKYITPGPYTSTSMLKITADPDDMARIIQKCWRGYRMLKFMKIMARIYRQLVEECKELEREKFIERRNRCIAEIQAFFYPCNMWDFDTIVYRLEQAALKKVDPEDECRNLRLLDSRRRAFLTADTRIRAVREDRAQRAKMNFLIWHCEPRRWLDRKGRIVEMMGLKNQAALECWNLFELLYSYIHQRSDDSRMEILLKARNSVEEHDCKLASQFRALIDQEIVLISKKIQQSNLVYLRRRIAGAYLQFVQNSHNCTCKSIDGNGCPNLFDYEFREPLEKNRIFCASCNRLLSRNKFPLSVRKIQANRCKACLRLYTNIRGQIDMKPYIYILKWLKERELDNLRMMDVLSPTDIRHLVLNIWHGRSVISEHADPGELLIPRFDLSKPWSPWNCILLTEEETEAHLTLNGGKDVYSSQLLKKIRLAHRTAKIDFRNLAMFTTCEKELEVTTEHFASASYVSVKSVTSKSTLTVAHSEILEQKHDY